MICLCCGYETDDKSNFNKHFLTEKHAWYSINCNEEKLDELVKNEKYLKCKYCKYITKRNDNLKRHVLTKHPFEKDENIIDLDNKESETKETEGKIKGTYKNNKKKNIINLNN